MKRKALLSLLFLGLVVIFVTACGGTKSDTEELKEVSLRLDWLFGSEHAPYYVAIEKGYFEEEGLNVTIYEGEGSSVSAKLVGTGDNTFAICAAGTVMLSVAEGVPIQAVMTIFQNSPTAIIFTSDNPITDPQDLIGKEVGVMPKSVTFNEWGAILDIHNLSLDEVHENAMDRTIVQPLLEGRIDAGIAWFINDGVQSRVQGGDTDWLKFSDIGLNIPSSTIIANIETIEDDPETVRAFVKAVQRGWQFTKDNPDEAYEIFMEQQPQVDAEFNEIKLPLVLELIDSDQGLSTFDDAAWESLKDLYMESDLLKVDLDLSKVYTSEFLP